MTGEHRPTERDVRTVARILFRHSWRPPLPDARADAIFDSMDPMPFEREAREIITALHDPNGGRTTST